MLVVFFIVVRRLPRLLGFRARLLGVEKIRTLRTGDIVLSSGRTFDGGTLQLWMDEIFTHIGIVYVSPDSGNVYIWNSDCAQDDAICVNCGHEHAGPQVQLLSDKLAASSTPDFYIVRTNISLPAAFNRSWMLRREGRRFRYELLALAHAAVPALVPQFYTSPDAAFCTELVAQTLNELLGWNLRTQTTPWQLVVSLPKTLYLYDVSQAS